MRHLWPGWAKYFPSFELRLKKSPLRNHCVTQVLIEVAHQLLKVGFWGDSLLLTSLVNLVSLHPYSCNLIDIHSDFLFERLVRKQIRVEALNRRQLWTQHIPLLDRDLMNKNLSRTNKRILYILFPSIC